MSTLSSANVTDVNLVLKERTHKIKMKYSMHQYSNSYAYFRQLAHDGKADVNAILFPLILKLRRRLQVTALHLAEKIYRQPELFYLLK